MFVWTIGFDLSFGLRIRQHSLCKRTRPMPTFMKPSHYELNFHLMQVLRSLLSSSATWSWWKCYFEPVSNALFWAIQGVCHLIHGKIKKKTMKLLAWMWLSLFDALLFILLFVYWYCLILKSKGNLGFYMTFLSIGLQPIGQIFSTLNF